MYAVHKYTSTKVLSLNTNGLSKNLIPHLVLSSLLNICAFEIRLFKIAGYIFLIIHEVVFRSVPIFVIEHVSGWDIPSSSLVILLQVSRRLAKWQKLNIINKRSLCGRKKSG